MQGCPAFLMTRVVEQRAQLAAPLRENPDQTPAAEHEKMRAAVKWLPSRVIRCIAVYCAWKLAWISLAVAVSCSIALATSPPLLNRVSNAASASSRTTS